MPENQEPQPKEKKYSVSTIIVTALAVIIIIVLAFLLYYYSTRPAPVVIQESAPIVKKTAPPVTPPAPQITPTSVIVFASPTVLPTIKKTGNCFASSVADPYRQDAYRCMVVNSIYDPCFTVSQKGFVYCQIGIEASTGFLIKLTKALPKPEVPPTIQENWAWFVELKDGTQCSPFTGTRPFFGTGSDAQVAYYGCKSDDATKQIVLLGDLTKGDVWTANEAILTKTGTNWTINSTQQVDINTVWQ